MQALIDNLWQFVTAVSIGILAGYIAGNVWPIGWLSNRGQDATNKK
jgi:hypothetical protein